MPLKYFLTRTCIGSGRLCGYGIMTFPAISYKTILIITSVEWTCLIITLRNRLNLHLSTIIGFGL